MTAIHKNSDMNRWYALVVLLILLVMVYFIAFHGIVSDHALLNEEIAELESDRQEYTELASLIPELQKRIKNVKETVGDNTNFLVADSYNLGTAELSHIFKTIVNGNRVERSECDIISNTNYVDKNPDQFEKIIIKVRMRCQFEKMIKTISDIEGNVPHLFIDNLLLDQRVIRRSSRRNLPPVRPMLEVRFDLYAYMNKPVKVRDQ